MMTKKCGRLGCHGCIMRCDEYDEKDDFTEKEWALYWRMIRVPCPVVRSDDEVQQIISDLMAPSAKTAGKGD